MRKIHVGFLSLAALISFAYLMMLGWYATPCVDDWGFVADVEKIGVLGLLKNMYLTWQPRWSCFFVDGFIFKFFGRAEHLWLFILFQLVIGYGAAFLLLKSTCRQFKYWESLVFAVVLTNLGIMALPEISTFYWLCTANYIHEIWATMYLCYFVFFCKKDAIQWIGSIICSLYLGGCAENYTPVLIAVLGLVWLSLLIRNKTWKFYADKKTNLLFYSLLIMGIGFVVVLLGPGNKVRTADLPESRDFMHYFALLPYIKQVLKASVIIALRLLSKGWYFVCALPIGYYLGGQKDGKSVCAGIGYRFAIATSLMIFTILITVCASVFGIGWYAPMRANSFMSFVVLVWIVYVGYLLGKRFYIRKWAHTTLLLSSMAIIATSILYIAVEYPIVRDYNEQVLAIHHRAQEQVELCRIEPLSIQPIQTPHLTNSYSYLRNAIQISLGKKKRYDEAYFPYERFDFSKQPSHWRNTCYKEWLGAEFDIIGWTNDD